MSRRDGNCWIAWSGKGGGLQGDSESGAMLRHQVLVEDGLGKCYQFGHVRVSPLQKSQS